MYTKQEIIIRNYRQGHSQRKIARDLQLSRKTVRRYIEEYEQERATSDSTEAAQENYLSHVPTYKMAAPRPKHKLTREVQSALDNFFEQNEKKKQTGLGKQLLKKKDILEELHRQGFDIGYTSVCNYISSKEHPLIVKEAFIRQAYLPGEVCEFDWGEIKVRLSGKTATLQLAVFTAAYSNFRFAFIYQRQDTLSFMESHVRFFGSIGGVYREMVYDNMRVAISKFVGRHEKEPTRSLLQLRAHYGFTHRFCNFYRGNEKGHVERSVEYVRRKAFALKDDFACLEEAEKQLEETLSRLNATKQEGTGKTALELFAQEEKALCTLPGCGLVCSEQVQLRVDKYATVSCRTNRYSVPDHLVGRFVDVNLLAREVHIYDRDKRVASHARSYGKHCWVVDIEHYLDTFKKKPGALPGSLALADSLYLRKLYADFFRAEPRGFVDLLSFCREHKISGERLEGSVRRLLGTPHGAITAEKLQALLGNNHEAPSPEEEDAICLMSKQQLSNITALMH